MRGVRGVRGLRGVRGVREMRGGCPYTKQRYICNRGAFNLRERGFGILGTEYPQEGGCCAGWGVCLFWRVSPSERLRTHESGAQYTGGARFS